MRYCDGADSSTGVFWSMEVMAMVYRGHIRNGRVEIDAEVPLPEGAAVEVTVTGNGSHPVAEPIPTLYDRLKPVVGGVSDLPPDFAENHDHYIHGTSKR